MNRIRLGLIVAACSAGMTGGLVAFAQQAASPGSHGAAGHADHNHGTHDHAAHDHDKKAEASKSDNTAKSDKDLIAVATGDDMGNVSTLVKAIKAADLVDTLKSAGPFTVFAPTNEAFEKLPAGKLDELLKPENKQKLRELLLSHVHIGKAVKASDLKTTVLSTADGKDVHVKKNGDTVKINNATVIKSDVMASNGVIHQIDAVVEPEDHNH